MNATLPHPARWLSGLFVVCVLLALAPSAYAQKKPSGGGNDASPPAQITNIKPPVVGFQEVTLVAAVTGDDGMTGTAIATELRFRPASACTLDPVTGSYNDAATQGDCFSDSNWANIPNGKSFSSPPPPGVLAAFRIPWTDHVLVPGTPYLFALRMVDDAGKRSPVSPIVAVTTLSASAMMPWGTPSGPIGVHQDNTTPRSALGYDAGQPVVAFAPSIKEVRYTRFDAATSSWTPAVAVETASTELGSSVELATVGGALGMAYGGQPALKYREFVNRQWSAPVTIASHRNSSSLIKALVATSGGPVLAYSYASTGFNIARRVNGTWVTTAYAPGAGTTTHNFGLAADPSDPAGKRLGLAYQTRATVTGGTDYRLYFATSSDGGATWGASELVDVARYRRASSETLGSERTGGGVAVAYDNDGVPHVKYSGGSTVPGMSQVFVARKPTGGTWAKEVVGYGDSGGVEGITFDAGNRLYVPFGVEDVDVVASRGWASTESWVSRVVLSGAPIQFSSVALGPGGPGAAYFATVGSTKELRYALMDPAPTAPTVASSSPSFSTSARESGAAVALYPNPFSTRATLRFGMAQAGRAEVVVYDLLGREVARPLDSDMEVGMHTVMIDGSTLVAGTYVVRLRAGGVVLTRTVTVTR